MYPRCPSNFCSLMNVVYAKLFQSSPTLCDTMDYSLPVSSVHWILQTRILEGIAKHAQKKMRLKDGKRTN